MKNTFVATRNIERFMNAIGRLERRGAPEAAMVLVTGEAGHGKTRTIQWFAAQHDAVYLRGKATWTPHWVLSELATELGEHPARKNEDLFAQVLAQLAGEPRPLVVDEIEHALHDRQCLDTIRDLSDLTEVPVVLVGMDGIDRRLRRHPQIYSRIATIVKFEALDRDDTKRLAETLCEVEIDDAVIERVLGDSGGFVRDILIALAEVERYGRRKGAPLTATDLPRTNLLVGRLARAAARPGLLRRVK